MPQRVDSKSNLCFVIMSFGDNSALKDFYIEAIKPTVEQHGFKCERVDEQQFNGSIKDRIVANLKEARFIVADLTEARPNCYYELGLAHALKKDVIHITNKKEDIHFDVNDFNFIIYSRLQELKEKLGDRIVQTIVNKTISEPTRTLWVQFDRERNTNDVKTVLDEFDTVSYESCFIEDYLKEGVDLSAYSFVLLSYDSSDKAKSHTSTLLSDLNNSQPLIPMVVYTTEQLANDEFTLVSSYTKHAFANMPNTLRDRVSEIVEREN